MLFIFLISPAFFFFNFHLSTNNDFKCYRYRKKAIKRKYHKEKKHKKSKRKKLCDEEREDSINDQHSMTGMKQYFWRFYAIF